MKHTFFLLAALPLFLFAQNEKGVNPVKTPPSGGGGATRAVVIGISDYQDAQIPDLRFAHRDAEAFANFLKSPAGGSLDGDHLQVLLNQNATAGRVAEALDALIEQAKEGEEVIIYFSGHGDVERKIISQPGFLLCWDAPSRVYMGGGTYSLAFLEAVVTTLSVENKAKVIVVTDACHAGKLAGSQIGGAKLTAANLARQFSNEVKILSCQPGELSLEGEQWGGGRGIFSYHLIDGLFGLADRNADGQVSLGELDRYLEDKVTAEAAPQSQVPMLLGNKTERLATVNPAILAALQKSKSSGLPVFAATEGRGFEDEILGKTDSSVRQLYFAFKKAVMEKRFFTPENDCAEKFYATLSQNETLAPLRGFMKRNYAAALQDDAQQAINKIMKMEPTEARLYRRERLEKYAPYPRYLARAAELLGPAHYAYPVLQARRAYFEGQVLLMKSPRNADPAIGQQILAKYRESLVWQPNFALAYFGMSEAFENLLPNEDSLIFYNQKAIDDAPDWIWAYTQLAHRLVYTFHDFGRAKPFLDQALGIAPENTLVWTTLGFWETSQGNFDAGESCYLKAIALDSSYNLPQHFLGTLYFNRGRTEEATRFLLKAAQSDKPRERTFFYLGMIHSNAGRYPEAENFLKKGLEIEPYSNHCLAALGGNYLKTNRVAEGKALLRQAMTLDSTSIAALSWLGEIYLDNELYAEAEVSFRKCIEVDSLDAVGWWGLGKAWTEMSRHQEAEQAAQKAIELSPKIAWHWFLLGRVYTKSSQFDKARKAYSSVAELVPDDPDLFVDLAFLESSAGKTTAAFAHLEQAITKGCPFEQLQTEPDLAPLRSLPEWKELMKKHFPDQAKD